MSKQHDDNRREFLLAALKTGAFAIGSGLAPLSALADPLGKVPKMLPATQSIYDFEGDVKVNGIAVTSETLIRSNDRVETGKNSRITFAVGKDAFLLRDNSDLTLSGEDLIVQALRLSSGALLSVFGKSATRRQLNTTTASIGIRGTGVYIESDPELSYVCTCYGTTDIASNQDANAQETIVSQHHDAPRYILANQNGGKLIRSAPFKNHTDIELALIETLVGRVPPFIVFDPGYDTPRRY